MSPGCRLILTILDLLQSQEEGNSQGSLNYAFFGDDFTPLYVGQVTRGSPGFTADLEGARGC